MTQMGLPGSRLEARRKGLGGGTAWDGPGEAASEGRWAGSPGVIIRLGRFSEANDRHWFSLGETVKRLVLKPHVAVSKKALELLLWLSGSKPDSIHKNTGPMPGLAAWAKDPAFS